MNEQHALPQTRYYCYIISLEFRAIVSTNAGPLSLPDKEALEMAKRYNALYPGANFRADYTTSWGAEYYAASFTQLPIDPNNTGGLCWGILSKLEWLERYAKSRTKMGWLSAVTRQT